LSKNHGCRAKNLCYECERKATLCNFQTFKDSLKFFAAPLASLTKTYGLENVANKPFFPHYLIRHEHLEGDSGLVLDGGLPDPAYYGADHMKDLEKRAFMDFWEANRLRVFDLRKEIIDYCLNVRTLDYLVVINILHHFQDVVILRSACIRFREELKAVTRRVEPFLDCATIASLTLRVYRAEFLQPNLLMNLPETGLNQRHRQSFAALKFFRVLEHVLGLPIRTAEWSIGEARVGLDTGHRIDGLIQLPPSLPCDGGAPRKLALEFNGCFYHG
jgi:hypothetical protein